MEPGDVTPVLLDAMVANKNIVPHLHLPLQSGSNAVLQKMNRQYNVDQYLEMIAMVNERLTVDGLPPAITTDIICGFPTETDEDFAQTVGIAKQVKYLHMHVFPYPFEPEPPPLVGTNYPRKLYEIACSNYSHLTKNFLLHIEHNLLEDQSK